MVAMRRSWRGDDRRIRTGVSARPLSLVEGPGRGRCGSGPRRTASAVTGWIDRTVLGGGRRSRIRPEIE